MAYILVNPKFSNSNIKSSKKNSSEAAEDIWSKLSENITNHAPNFYFTIQETNGNKLYHYVINETVEAGKVKYNLKEFKGKKIDNKSFLSELKQEGGKKHRHRHHNDDDSSSSSSSSSEEVFTFPAGKTHKDLFLTYYPTIYGVPNIITPPTFISSFTPYPIGIKIIPNMLIFTP
jgi:hypothetical protein